MREWIIKERAVTWMDNDFDPKWLPAEALNLFSLRRKADTGETGIEVPGYVGVLNLFNGDRLRIKPKSPMSFLQMFAACNNVNFKHLGKTSAAEGEDASQLLLLSDSFTESLSDIISKGKLFQWKKEIARSSYLPSVVDWGATAIHTRIHASHPFTGISYFRTFDTPESRVLSVAAQHLCSYLLANHVASDKLKISVLQKFILSKNTIHILEDIQTVHERLVSKYYVGQRSYYESALTIALIILGFEGISYESSNPLSADGFVVNSDALFEEWVRVSLRKAVTSSNLPYSISKEYRYKKLLFTNSAYYLVPDILIMNAMNVIALGDAKNKTPGTNDFYQMLTYLNMYGLNSGFLVSSDGLNGGQVEQLHTIGVRDVIINVYHLDMSDPVACEAMLKKVIDQLF